MGSVKTSYNQTLLSMSLWVFCSWFPWVLGMPEVLADITEEDFHEVLNKIQQQFEEEIRTKTK